MRTLGDRQRKSAPETKQEEAKAPESPTAEAPADQQTQSFDESVTIS